ncbi:MAG: hypothetical protein ACK528_05135 [Alphaproteobacteria bacterium]
MSDPERNAASITTMPRDTIDETTKTNPRSAFANTSPGERPRTFVGSAHGVRSQQRSRNWN